MFKKSSYILLITALIVFVICKYTLGDKIAYTMFVTSFVLILNLLGLYLLWSLVIQKKSIALGVGIIILKYPLLGYIVYQMAQQKWFHSMGIFVGFVTFVFSIVLAALLRRF